MYKDCPYSSCPINVQLPPLPTSSTSCTEWCICHTDELTSTQHHSKLIAYIRLRSCCTFYESESVSPQFCLTFVTPWTVALQAPLSMGIPQAKNTGVANHSLLQGIFPTQGSNPGLLCCRQILYHLSHLEQIDNDMSLLSYRVVQFSSVQLLSHVRLLETP